MYIQNIKTTCNKNMKNKGNTLSRWWYIFRYILKKYFVNVFSFLSYFNQKEIYPSALLSISTFSLIFLFFNRKKPIRQYRASTEILFQKSSFFLWKYTFFQL